MALLNIVPPPNFGRTLAPGLFGGPGGTLHLTAPVVAQERYGAFLITAVCCVSTSGSDPAQGVVGQLVSSVAGNIGPAITYNGASTVVEMAWVDFSNVGVGNTVQYKLNMTAISNVDIPDVAAGAGAIVVREL